MQNKRKSTQTDTRNIFGRQKMIHLRILGCIKNTTADNQIDIITKREQSREQNYTIVHFT